MGFVLLVVLTVVYALVGIVIAEPYTFLASGNNHHFVWTVVLSPTVLLVLAFVYFGLVWRGGWKEKLSFSALVFYFLSPIILNGVSLLLGYWNYKDAAGFLFMHRFLILPLAPLLAILLGVGSGYVKDWRQTLSLRKKMVN